MISHGKDIKIFTGNANPALAQEICKIIGTKLGEAEVKSFADGEVSVSLYETVRGSDVFVVQSTCKPVNDNLMELLIMVDACRRASAGRITAVMPYFGYARQDELLLDKKCLIVLKRFLYLAPDRYLRFHHFRCYKLSWQLLPNLLIISF